jgi:hypothetical protein
MTSSAPFAINSAYLGHKSVPDWHRENAKSSKGRVSSAVEQRFCKPLVGSSILSPGTNKNKHLA